MKFYQEITIIPNHEIDKYFIFSKLFTQIHLALTSIKEIEGDKEKSPAGVSFPEYKVGKKSDLGSKLRLFSLNEVTLQNLDIRKWLSQLSDYIHISSIREVPQKIDGYVTFSRHQPKINKERLARRYAKRHNISYDSALDFYKEMNEELSELPFIKLKSLSSKNVFSLHVK